MYDTATSLDNVLPGPCCNAIRCGNNIAAPERTPLASGIAHEAFQHRPSGMRRMAYSTSSGLPLRPASQNLSKHTPFRPGGDTDLLKVVALLCSKLPHP